MSLVEVERTVQDGPVGRPLHLQVTRRDALQHHVGARHETVEEREREVVQVGLALEEAPVAVEVGALQCQHFEVARAHEGRGVVFAALLREVEHFEAEVAERNALVAESVGLHRCHSREVVFVGVARHVHVAAQHAVEDRQVGQHRRQFAEVKLVHAHREVVHRVARFAVDLQSRTVVGEEVHVGANELVLTEENEIVLVHREVAVGQHGVFGVEADVHAAFAQGGLHAEVHALFPLAVEVAQFHARPRTEHVRLQSYLHRRGIFLVVLHPAVELYARRVLENVGLHRVEEQSAELECPDARIAAHARARVGMEVNEGRGEGVALHACYVVDRIVASRVEIQAHYG